MKPSPATVKKLRKLQKFLLQEPRRFDMDWWGIVVKNLKDIKLYMNNKYAPINQNGERDYDGNLEAIFEQKPPCGSAACLAGSALMMAGLIKPRFEKVNAGEIAVFDFGDRTPENAQKYLEISSAEGNKLFYMGNWPSDIEKDYRFASTPLQKVKVANRRIDHYIETGE